MVRLMTPESLSIHYTVIDDFELHKFVIHPKSVKLNVQSPEKN